MPSTPPPLWHGYDDAGEDELIALLDGKVDAPRRRRRPDGRRARSRGDFAQAIASHEWLKQKLGPTTTARGCTPRRRRQGRRRIVAAEGVGG